MDIFKHKYREELLLFFVVTPRYYYHRILRNGTHELKLNRNISDKYWVSFVPSIKQPTVITNLISE